MKKLALSILVLSIFATGCKKDDTNPAATPTPVSTGTFSWTAGSGPKVTADSSHYYSSFTTIFAFKNGSSNSIEINLSSLAVGAYSLSSATGNALTFVTASTT